SRRSAHSCQPKVSECSESLLMFVRRQAILANPNSSVDYFLGLTHRLSPLFFNHTDTG
ncbi:MAG: hypothetical protein ACI97A_004169, partial [Planctomycetota bacterium]